MRKSTFAIVLMVAVAVPVWALSPTTVTYEINHRSFGDGQLPGINVSHGQKINFIINDTDSRCFNYNPKAVTDQPRALMTSRSDVSVVEFPPITHDEETAKYQIDVVKKPAAEIAGTDTAACAASPLAPRTWTIPVYTYWRFAMTGAITGDTLTKPQYFLEAGKDSANKDGFYIRKNGAGQDRLRFGMAAMAHLYHPHRGLWGLNWAPISFGVGLQANEVQYFVGTTARFGTRAFITGGVTVGPRDRLPNGVLVDKTFVTDAKTLDTLPKKTSQGLFLSIGFSFFESNAGKLTGLIAKP